MKYDPVDEAIAEFEGLDPGAYMSSAYANHIVRRLRWHWLPFLQRTNRRRDQVTIADFVAFENELIVAGRSASNMRFMKHCVVAYYRLLADKLQHAQYRAMARDVADYRTSKARASARPWEAYPMDMLPKILVAARAYARTPKPHLLAQQKDVSDLPVDKTDPNEDYVLAVLGVYVGMRSSVAYGLKVAAIDFETNVLNVHVKGGYDVPVVLHTRAAKVLRDHLDERAYTSDFVFRYGRDPIDFRAGTANDHKVSYAMARIAKAYIKLYGKKDHDRMLTVSAGGTKHGFVYHSFRDSIGRYGRQFGLDEEERALLLSHSAKSITQHYSRADIERVRKRWERIDLGNAEWVAAHMDAGVEVTALTNGNGGDSAALAKVSEQLSDLLAENKALRDEIAKLRGGVA